MEIIDKEGTIRRAGKIIQVLHEGEWIEVGQMKFGQFVPIFPNSVERGLVLGLQTRATIAIAANRTRSIFGWIKRLIS